MHFTAGLPSFYKPFTKKLGSIFGCPYQFNGKNIPLGTTPKLPQPGKYDFSTLPNTYTGKLLIGISQTGIELMFSEIYPESTLDSNISEKRLVRLAGFRKNMRPYQIKGSLYKPCQKKIKFLEAKETADSHYSNKHS